MKPEDFFLKYAPDAIASMKSKGIPASVTLAQAATESGWGVAAFGNNFFGIKTSKDWKGKNQLWTTTEVLHSATEAEYLSKTGKKFPGVISITKQPSGLYLWKVKDWFRLYDTPRESFEDHANFFLVNSRYHQAIVDHADGLLFAHDIFIAGYATAPNYEQTLAWLIKHYNLTQYDNL